MQRAAQVGRTGRIVCCTVETKPGQRIPVVVHIVNIPVIAIRAVKSHPQRVADLIDLIRGKLHKGAGFHHGIRKQAAELRSHTAAGDAVIHLHMLGADPGRNILRITVHIDHASAPGITLAGSRRLHTGIQTDCHVAEHIAIIQSHRGKTVVDGLHDHFPQARCRVCIVAGEVDLLRLVVAAPDRCGIILGIAAEPAVTVTGGGAGLAGNVLSRENRRRTGTGVGRVVQAVVHIVDSLFAENLPALLLVVKNDLAVAVINFGVGSCRPVDTVVGKGGIGSGHLADRGANRQCTQSQRSKRDIGHIHAAGRDVPVNQIVLSEIVLCETEAVIRADLIQSVCRDGIDGRHNALENCLGVAVDTAVVLGECTAIVGQGQVLDDCGGTDAALFKSGSVNRQRLFRRTGLQLCLGCLVIGKEIRLFTNAARQCHNIAGGIIDDNNAGLELLGASCGGNVVQIRIDGIHLILDIHIQSGINVVTTLLNLFQIVVAGSLIHVIP